MFSEVGAAWVAAAVAVGAFVLTILQTRIAKSAVEHAKEVHSEQMQPYVFADIRAASHDKQLVVLFLRNEGPTVATNIRVVFDHPLKYDPHMGDDPRSEWTMTSLPPGAQLEWNLGFSGRFFEENEEKFIKTTVTFHGRGGAEETTYYLDLYNLGQTSGGGKTFSNLAESIGKVESHLKKIEQKIPRNHN